MGMSEREPADVPERGAPQTFVGGITVGRVFGVPLVVSRWWIAVVLVIVVSLPDTLRNHVNGLGQTSAVIASVGLVVLIYLGILLHEAAHVFVAKKLDLRVGRVVLQLLGAQSEILDEPQTPARAYLVAAAGPTASVLLAAVGAAAAAGFETNSLGWVIAISFAWLNAALAIFNLLPGLPLDGGQMLRAGVWHATRDKVRGTIAAGWAGRGIALALVIGGVALFSPHGDHASDAGLTADQVTGLIYTVLIAGFIFLNANLTIAQARTRAVLPSLQVAELVRPALTVEAQLPLAEAVRRARAIGARALVIVDSRDHWSGIVSEAAVQATPIERQPWMSVSDLARPVEDGLVLSPTLGGEALVMAMQLTPASEYLVADTDGVLRGVLSSADITAAMRAAGGGAQRAPKGAH
jgi:Zn-dependent protease